MRTRLIVLDVDDTLYLERDYVHSGFRAVSDHVETQCGFDRFHELAWEAFLEGRRRTIFDEVLTEVPSGIEPRPSVPDLVSVYRHHVPDIELCPDAREFLDQMRGSAHLGVVTDGPAVSQRNKLDALGLSRWISAFVVTDEHGPDWHKPSVLPFRRLEEIFDVHGSDCVYIADNPHKDFIGPVALGWRTVRVARPLGLHVDAPDEAGSRPETRVEDFSGVADLLR